MQVLPDLTKFMDSIHNKMMTVHKMIGQLEMEAGGLVAAKEFLISYKIMFRIPHFAIWIVWGTAAPAFQSPWGWLTTWPRSMTACLPVSRCLQGSRLTSRSRMTRLTFLRRSLVASFVWHKSPTFRELFLLQLNSRFVLWLYPQWAFKTALYMNWIHPLHISRDGFAITASHLNETMRVFKSTHQDMLQKYRRAIKTIRLKMPASWSIRKWTLILLMTKASGYLSWSSTTGTFLDCNPLTAVEAS